MTPSDNLGKAMTKRIRAADGTTLVLNFEKSDANAIRAFVASIHLKEGRKASLSLIARRAVQSYVDRMESTRRANPLVFDCELAELGRMVTKVPQPALRSKKKPS